MHPGPTHGVSAVDTRPTISAASISRRSARDRRPAALDVQQADQ